MIALEWVIAGNHAGINLYPISWWRHGMGTLSALLVLCVWAIHRCPVDFPHKGPAMRGFGVFFFVWFEQIIEQRVSLSVFWDVITLMLLNYNGLGKYICHALWYTNKHVCLDLNWCETNELTLRNSKSVLNVILLPTNMILIYGDFIQTGQTDESLSSNAIDELLSEISLLQPFGRKDSSWHGNEWPFLVFFYGNHPPSKRTSNAKLWCFLWCWPE